MTDRVRYLVLYSNVLVINEVCTTPQYNDLGAYLSLATPTPNHTRRGGRVAIITENGTLMRPLPTIACPKFQLASVSVFGRPLFGAYLFLTCTPKYQDEFL